MAAADGVIAQDGIEVFSDSVNSARLTPRARLRRLERTDLSGEPPVEFWLLEPLKVVLCCWRGIETMRSGIVEQDGGKEARAPSSWLQSIELTGGPFYIPVSMEVAGLVHGGFWMAHGGN
eukprot:INCI5398.1.p1 GENE.INCI5398.1~~INCI5398.1.p1  ORF type:complete len:120 (+),score=12.23 INCI5398.1:340-699(+)